MGTRMTGIKDINDVKRRQTKEYTDENGQDRLSDRR